MHSNSSICWVPQPHTQLKCFHKCYLILSFLYKSCSRGVFHGIITFGPGIPGDHSRLSHKGVVAPLLYTVILILILRNLILQVLVIFCLSFIPVCATIANMVQTHVHELPYNTAWLHIWLSLRWRHNDHAGVSNHQPHGCLLNRLFRRKSKKTSKLRVTGLCGGNSPGTGEFPAQMASYAENVSIWWRHHDLCVDSCHWYTSAPIRMSILHASFSL